MGQQFDHITGRLAAFGHCGDIDANAPSIWVIRIRDAFGVTRTAIWAPSCASSESAPFSTVLRLLNAGGSMASLPADIHSQKPRKEAG